MLRVGAKDSCLNEEDLPTIWVAARENGGQRQVTPLNFAFDELLIPVGVKVKPEYMVSDMTT